MKIIIDYLLAPFLKKIEMLNNDVNESKSNIVNLDKSIHKLQVELCDENKKKPRVNRVFIRGHVRRKQESLGHLR